MTDHTSQKLTPREMVRAHAYPVLAAVSTVALVVIAALFSKLATSLDPIAKRAHYQNLCIEEMLPRTTSYGSAKGTKHAQAVTWCNNTN